MKRFAFIWLVLGALFFIPTGAFAKDKHHHKDHDKHHHKHHHHHDWSHYRYRGDRWDGRDYYYYRYSNPYRYYYPRDYYYYRR